jgi:aspartate racemase
MGPLASAEFLSTLYHLNTPEPEQEAPVCIMISDPTFPDRTAAILSQSTEALAALLTRALEDLSRLGADRIVIACVTTHHLLDQIPPVLRRKVVSLIDLIVDEIVAAPRSRLLLATAGTRAARIFGRHERWRDVQAWIVHPTPVDQQEIHDWIYQFKRGRSGGEVLAWLQSLPPRYGVEGLVFGCTELHLLQRVLSRYESDEEWVLDPLVLVARKLPSLLGRRGGQNVRGAS